MPKIKVEKAELVKHSVRDLDLYLGDCLEVLKSFPDNSFDSICTDPPAGISFMGKIWDNDKGGRDKWIEWLTSVSKECFRVCKPGSHALVWALPRTSHWTATAFENAGWEIRDIINHIFGSGFPKSRDISAAIDHEAGIEREVIGSKVGLPGYSLSHSGKGGVLSGRQDGSLDNSESECSITAPATDAAKQWVGYGSNLKPANEHWILCRKLVEGTIAENVQKHGVGAINIDGCRVPLKDGEDPITINTWDNGAQPFGDGAGKPFSGRLETKGRWPANVIHDGSEEVLKMFPICKTGGPGITKKNDTCVAFGSHKDRTTIGYAARFFYCIKASPSEKGKDCLHPTVKAVRLMRYLARLITPPKGIVLDCFMGSGTTGIACYEEGFKFVGIEKEPEYFEMAKKRIESGTSQGKLFT